MDELALSLYEHVVRTAELHPRTSPGFVLSEGVIPDPWYFRTVRKVLELEEERERWLTTFGIGYVDDTLLEGRTEAGERLFIGGRNGGRGIIGSLGAISWPRKDVTYEGIIYRGEGAPGTPRKVDVSSLVDLETVFGSLFDTTRDGDPVCIPNTPCPVLLGLRGLDMEEVATAIHLVRSEPTDGYTIFETNHATDDHVYDLGSTYDVTAGTPSGSGGLRLVDRSTYSMSCNVTGTPWTIQGGHVFVPVWMPAVEGPSPEDHPFAGVSLTLAAFEPTGPFRDVVRALSQGDTVIAVGSYRSNEDDDQAGEVVIPSRKGIDMNDNGEDHLEFPERTESCGQEAEGQPSRGTINLEKLKVVSTVKRYEKVANPTCSNCGKNMKSIGAGAGYRCRRCGTSADEAIHETRTAAILPGWYDVPPGARRHLSRPGAWADIRNDSS